jgi:RND family efflux transporter MFP subunit
VELGQTNTLKILNPNEAIMEEKQINENKTVPPKSWKQKLLALFLIICIFAIGIGFAKYLITTKPKIKKTPPKQIVTPVKVIDLKQENSFMNVYAIGTVIPAKELSLKPLVSGTVKYVNPMLIPGSILKKNDLAIKIDDKDYQIIMKIKQANLKKVSADLKLEKGKQQIAKNEWDLIKNNSDNNSIFSDTMPDLALRKPQLEKLKATEEIAHAELEQAKLNLERTNVKIPFNSIVQEKYISLGSMVNTQTNIAKIIGTDEFWIKIFIPADKLKSLDINHYSTSFANSKVEIKYLNANYDVKYEGKIIRLLTDVDEKGLMSKLLISVKNPLSTKYSMPLLLGSQVKVKIRGKKLDNIFKIPRHALTDENEVLIAKNDKLEIRKVDVVWDNQNWVFIKNNIQEGEKLIISRIPAPIEGMKLEIIK